MTKTTNEQFATWHVDVGTTPTLIVRGREGHDAVTIQVLGSITVLIGKQDVTIDTGFPIPGAPGAHITLSATEDIYGVVASGVQPVAVLETY
jgi:hypothetical protein